MLNVQGRDCTWEKAADSHGGWKLQTGLLLYFGIGYKAGILYRLCLSREKWVPIPKHFPMSLM